jgi:hypothetical protein
MKTKSLLIAAAALAAGVISSQAQVYSQNIVGYVNVVLQGNGNYNLIANPLDDGNGNQLTNLINATGLGLFKQSQCLTWNSVGGGYITVNATGTPATWAGNATLPPGVGFFLRVGKPGDGSPNVTNTFVGSVVVPSAGSVTNIIYSGYQIYGSVIPYAGNIANSGSNGGDTNLDFGGPLSVKKSQILTFVPGAGFVADNKTGTPPLWANTVPITVGQGFFINNLGSQTNTVQNASY